ncbi:MAG: hypothetical protein QNJ81_10930 [Acidimicrobiia bacterium]|nr:hypothetical protein [Acidimicrobiia bacterium]
MNNPTLLHMICDYAPDGLEFAEIVTRLHTSLTDPGSVLIRQTATPPLDTISVGFVTGQLGLGPSPQRMVIFGNAAPRRDQEEMSAENRGRGLRYAKLDNDVEVVSVDSQYAFSFIKDRIVEYRDVASPAAGSQFRSRDYFPRYVAAIVDGDYSVLTDRLDPNSIEEVPSHLVAWTDGFGNIKTTVRKSHLDSADLAVGDRVLVTLNGVTLAGVISDGGFTVPRGVLAVNAGSSGYDDPFVELFLRVHHMSEKTAAVRFDHPEGGTPLEIEPLRSL